MTEKRWIDEIEQRTQRQEHNRDDVPALLGYARELERENERLKEQRDRYHEQACWFAGQAGEAHRRTEGLEAGRGGLGAHLAHLAHLEETTDWQAVQREIEENDRKLREAEDGEACRLPSGEKL